MPIKGIRKGMPSEHHLNRQLVVHDEPKDDIEQSNEFNDAFDMNFEADGNRESGEGRFDPLPEDLPGPARGFLPMRKGSVSIDKEIMEMEDAKRALHSKPSLEGSVMQTRTLKLPPEDGGGSAESGSADEGDSRELSKGEGDVTSEMSFDLLKLQPHKGKPWRLCVAI